MKEQIHTIPVMEALQETPDQGCPFCVMHQKLNADAVSFIMGPAYMEDDIRMETNHLGFCAEHLQKMYAEKNRLGLALMLHTHLQELNKNLEAAAKNKITRSSLGKLSGWLRAEESCYLCRRIDNTFIRYMDTFFYVWMREKEVPALMAKACCCLPHFKKMLEVGAKALDKKRYADFLALVIPRQQACLKTMEEDLDWFVCKFDYRNADEPWKNAKDALPRAMTLLHGQP